MLRKSLMTTSRLQWKNKVFNVVRLRSTSDINRSHSPNNYMIVVSSNDLDHVYREPLKAIGRLENLISKG